MQSFFSKILSRLLGFSAVCVLPILEYLFLVVRALQMDFLFEMEMKELPTI
jgi:hypothetical protein